MCNIVQAFLNARRLLVPPPARPRAVIEEEDSQQEYAQDDAFFDDPAVIAAMGDIDAAFGLQNNEAAVCQVRWKPVRAQAPILTSIHPVH